MKKVAISALVFGWAVQVFGHHAMEYIEMESYSTARKGEVVFHFHYDYMVDKQDNPMLDHWEFTPGLSYGIIDKLMFDFHTHFAKFGNDHVVDTIVNFGPGGPSPFMEAIAFAIQLRLPENLPVDIALAGVYELPFPRSKDLLDGQQVIEGIFILAKDFGMHSNICLNVKYGKDGDENVKEWAFGAKMPLSPNPHGIAGGVEVLGDFDMNWAVLPGVYFPLGGENTIFKTGLEFGEGMESIRANVTLMQRF